MTLDQLLTGVKDIGGWFVVVWMVWWLTRRWELQMTKMNENMASMIDVQRSQLSEEQRAHAEILATQAELLRAQAEVNKELQRLKEAQ